MSRDDIGGRIFIGGLDHNCDEIVLEKSFSMFGDIVQVMVMRDRETNKSRGFAFLSFKEQSSADDAIRRMHGVEIMGRCVTVRKAEKQSSMADRPRRGGFRGGGRGGDRFSGRTDRYDDGRGRSDGRRSSFDSYRSGGGGGGRDSYSDVRRSTYDSRGGGVASFDDPRDDARDSRRGYGASSGGYGDRANPDTRSSSYDYRRADNSDSYRYTESRREDFGSRGYATETVRDAYNGRYEASRGRSRSPVTRYNYQEESPPRSRRMPVGSRREYSPPAVHRSEQVTRDYSPPAMGSRRPEGSGYHDRREFADATYSPPARRRMRDPSPEDYSGRYAAAAAATARATTPPGRDRAYGSRSDGYSRSSPGRKADYAQRRSHDVGSSKSRDAYADSASSRAYAAPDRSGSSYNGFYKGRLEAGHADGDAGRYSSSRYRAASPTVVETGRSSAKRTSQRSHSPAEHRSRRY